MSKRYWNNPTIANYIKKRLQKYKDYTYQRLLAEETSLLKKIKIELNKIRELNIEIKKLSNKESTEQAEERKMKDFIWNEKVEKEPLVAQKINLQRPSRSYDGIFKLRYLLALGISIFIIYLWAPDAWPFSLILAIGPAILLIFLFNLMLENADSHEEEKLYEETKKYNEKISQNFNPSQKFINYKKKLEELPNIYSKNKEIKKKLYNERKDSEFEILVLKKLIIDFKNLKRNANEKEKSAKIAALESEKRIGAQTVKEKLIKSVKTKDYWDCPYCEKNKDFKNAQADHIHPVNKGGLSTMQNMILICSECNSKKTNLTLRAFCKKFKLNYENISIKLEKAGKDV